MDTVEVKKKKSSTPKQNISQLQVSIDNALRALLNKQDDYGYWCFELEADCTIPAEYIIMMHFMDEIDHDLQDKIAVYLRRNQARDGGWPLFYGAEMDISCSVKAYFALKLAGDNPDEPHMVKARNAILEKGGAAKSNVFTRIMLATFGQIPWRGVPFIPVETMLFPQWFPFHLLKVAYWSRTVMVPLFILCSYKVSAKNPGGVHIRELFVTPPEEEKNYFEFTSRLNRFIYFLERIGFHIEGFIPSKLRSYATKKAESWFIERLNGEDGLGAIFPAMVNAYEALDFLGYDKDHPYRTTAKKALEKLLVIRENEAYCQPCVSPVWDTLLASCALHENGNAEATDAAINAANWMIENQLDDEPADWKQYKPNLKGGGWPFQFKNDYYPDLDDTAFAAYALQLIDPVKYKQNILRAAYWLKGMQSRNGGFAAFDMDNTYYYLNEIPFADHGALLDPPTSDVTARCVMLFGLLKDDYPEFKKPMEDAIRYLSAEQESDGSWFGRWGTNYIYGTWSVLIAFEAAGIPPDDPRMRKAASWLKSVQREDGGWGEDNWSYHEPDTRGQANSSNAFQTAWALLGLIAAGESKSEEVKNGIEYLLNNQYDDGLWYGPEFTAPGFPRVFYLKYHGYDKYFPLWALSRYRNEINQQP
ncbi:MAG: squalene--hopene cyclase [Balneolaceae bacterium]